MEFYNYKCPVCGERFKNGDDIVVCPECGAPHHRQCYEVENHCAYEDKHSEDFDFKEESAYNPDEDFTDDGEKVICPKCQTENEKGTFYCIKCGFPVGLQNNQNNQSYQNNQNSGQPFSTGMPFGGQPFANAFDPMGGVNPDEDMGDGVTAGEISKFVKNNTPYFIRVFKNIKDFSRGKFNICAFLFSGGYLLYRKMYKLGILFSSLLIALKVADLYIQFNLISDSAKQILNGSQTSYTQIFSAIRDLSFNDQLMLMLSGVCSILGLVIEIIIGVYANKWYFKHCKEKISLIKKETDQPDQYIEKLGGVNTPLVFSILGGVLVLQAVFTLLQIPISIFI